MRLIQEFLPNPRLTEIHRVFLKAKPEKAWNIARHIDMAQIGWVKALFNLRTLPDRILGHEVEAIHHLGVDDIMEKESEPGFKILAEEIGHEVVVGAIGQPWHLKI